MIQAVPPFDPEAPVIVIGVGNSNTSIATYQSDELKTPLSVPSQDAAGFSAAYDAHLKASGEGSAAATIISSVVPDVLARLMGQIERRVDKTPLVIGDSIPLPMDVAVVDPQAIGTDRVCQAAAAYQRLQTACTVVSFGTAVTVDLVDADGTLLGGAILPGLDLQLRSLHEHTAQLPVAPHGIPDLPYGRTTVDAIQTGVGRGIVGAVRGIVEGYATYLTRWPQVVATGGDAPFFRPYCDFIDTFVSHLALRGIGYAYRKHLIEMGA
jgi:type III pantothenate kinase